MVGQVPLYNYGTLFEQDSGVECCDGTSICAGTRYLYSQSTVIGLSTFCQHNSSPKSIIGWHNEIPTYNLLME